METCQVCGGELCLLGAMGTMFLAVRCRMCGQEQIVMQPEEESYDGHSTDEV